MSTLAGKVDILLYKILTSLLYQ